MKILQIVPSISLVYGGPSQMVLGLSKALANEGIYLTILTTNANGDVDQEPLNVAIAQPIWQDSYQVIYFPCSPFRRYKFSVGLLNWLANHAHEYDLAHIHALFSPVSSLAAMICRIRGLPYILRPLGTLDPADLKKKYYLKQIYGYLLEKPNLAHAAAIHFTSQQECDISSRFGVETKDIVVPLGVEINPVTIPQGKARERLMINDIPLILFMSRIDPKKGLELIIAALIKLLEQGLNFHFVVAGANPQDQEYENTIIQTIKQSTLANHTTINGFVTGEEKIGLLQDADLFVLPSAYENFGIAVVEAMAYETPVIISQGVYIWQEIESANAGWITKANNQDNRQKGQLNADIYLEEIEGLSKVIGEGITNQELRKAKGKNARELVEKKYKWQAIACQIKEIYTKLILDATVP